MDGKTVKLSEKITGVNFHPLQPWCRSTTVPYCDDIDEDEERAARNSEGKSHTVPNTDYKEWYKNNVEDVSKGDKSGILSDKKWLEANFGSKKKLKYHIKKHLHQYEGMTTEEYITRARELLALPLSDNVEGFISNEDKIYKYDNLANDLVIGNTSGEIATLFKPEEGNEYCLSEIKLRKKE